MPLKRINKLRGLDLRSNPLFQEDGTATIAENVQLDAQGILRKRFGFEPHSTLAGTHQLIDFYNEYTQEEELLAVTTTGLFKYDTGGSTWNAVPSGAENGTAIAFPNKMHWTVHRGILYLTDPELSLPLLKYDGDKYYRAGLPPTIPTGNPTGSTYYVLILLEFTDAQGNFVFSSAPSNNISFICDGGGSVNITMPIGNGGIAGTELFYGLNSGPQSLRYRMYASLTPNFGQKLVKSGNVDASDVSDSISFTGAELATAVDSGEDLSEVYDITYFKRLPPRAKHIASYGDLLVLANLDIRFNFSPTQFKPNEVRWSDLSTGGSPESFPALNASNLGSTRSGIEGLFGDSDNLVAFKYRSVFNLSGNLFNGNYRVRDSLSDDIGCVAANSIYKVEGGGVFLSERGIYWTSDGIKPTEFSDRIEPIFTRDTTGLDFTKCEVASDYFYERLLFFIPAADPENSIVVVYDYYHKEWFIYKDMDASGGFTIHQRELYHCDGTNIYKRTSNYRDDSSAIKAKYATSWNTEQFPSIDKKYTHLHVLSIEDTDFSLSVTPQYDWKESDEDTAVEVTVAAADLDTDLPLEPVQARGMRVVLENSEIDEPMTINALRYVVEKTQEEPKGDD